MTGKVVALDPGDNKMKGETVKASCAFHQRPFAFAEKHSLSAASRLIKLPLLYRSQ